MTFTTKPTVTFMEDRLAGGIGRVIINLSNTMLTCGTAVDLLLKTTDGQYVEKLQAGVRIVNVPTYHRYTGIPHVVRYLWRTPSAALIVPSERLAAIALAARRFSFHKPKILACVHSIDPGWLTGTKSPAYTKRLNRIQRYYAKCDKVICVSNELRQRFLLETRLAPEKVCSIYNPVITEEVYSLSEEPPEHPWFAEDDTPVILGAGRLEPNKDFVTLIQAFADVRQALKCRLLILGEGSSRTELGNLIHSLQLQEWVDLPGEVNNPYAYMRRAALFVSPSIYEGLGNVLIEALALGTPVISTNCPYGPAEILDNGQHGGLVPVGDVQALATAIREALRSPRVQQVPKAAIQRFEAMTSAKQYLEVCGIHLESAFLEI